MLIVDAHQDLAWNMLTYGRDYVLPAAAIRQREAGSEIPARNGDTLLGWPDFQRGRVAVVFATLFVPPARRREPWESQYYYDANQAYERYLAQLDVYYRLADSHADKFHLLQTHADLKFVLDAWEPYRAVGNLQPDKASLLDPNETNTSPGCPVGLVVLMEGAEAVQEPAELEEWWRRGVRVIGPAWSGTRFCGGTNEPGNLTPQGYALLEGMAAFGFTLDLSHMDEIAALQALDFYPGRIIASHSNAASLLKGIGSNRHLSDRLIQGLIERDAVIGIVPLNTFLNPGWRHGDPRHLVGLQDIVAQIDHICQIAGDAHHVGLGTDFDGGFGLQSVPQGIETIADLQKLAPLLAEHGYIAADIAAIFGENWLDLLHQTLPDSL